MLRLVILSTGDRDSERELQYCTVDSPDPSLPQQAPPTPAVCTHTASYNYSHSHRLEHLRFLRGSPRDRSPSHAAVQHCRLRARQQVARMTSLFLRVVASLRSAAQSAAAQAAQPAPVPAYDRSLRPEPTTGAYDRSLRPEPLFVALVFRLVWGQAQRGGTQAHYPTFLFPTHLPISYACLPPWGSSRCDCAAPARR